MSVRDTLARLLAGGAVEECYCETCRGADGEDYEIGFEGDRIPTVAEAVAQLEAQMRARGQALPTDDFLTIARLKMVISLHLERFHSAAEGREFPSKQQIIEQWLASDDPHLSDLARVISGARMQ